MGGTQPLFDMSKAQPIQGAPLFDMSKAKPVTATPNPNMPGPTIPKPTPVDVKSPEGPIAQGLTTFETRLSEAPAAIGRMIMAKHWPIVDAKNFHELGEDLKSLNPIDTSEGSLPMNIGGTAANILPLAIDLKGGGIGESPLGSIVKKGASGAMGTIGDFARAPSDPDLLYRSYLKPVKDLPHVTPNAPAPVLQAIFRDMEAAGEGDIASRIRSGQATIGDLDAMRMRANRLAKSIYRSPGNYSPGMAEGANALAGAIRERIYPAIEKAQNMEPGSLQKVKNLQGKQMEAERNPTLTNKLIKHVGGAGAGSVLGYKIGGWPGSVVGAALGERFAEPIAASVDRGLIGLRTKTLGATLPEPGMVPRLGLPPARGLSPVESEPGMPAFTQYTNPTTLLERKGRLLPERTGGIEMPPAPEEKVPPSANWRIARNLKTGKMVRQYLTSTGGKRVQ